MTTVTTDQGIKAMPPQHSKATATAQNNHNNDKGLVRNATSNATCRLLELQASLTATTIANWLLLVLRGNLGDFRTLPPHQ
eukprot:gene2519-5441_t